MTHFITILRSIATVAFDNEKACRGRAFKQVTRKREYKSHDPEQARRSMGSLIETSLEIRLITKLTQIDVTERGSQALQRH